MNKEELNELTKEEIIDKYIALENSKYYLIGKYAVLEARYEQVVEMNNMLIERETKNKILKR